MRAGLGGGQDNSLLLLLLAGWRDGRDGRGREVWSGRGPVGGGGVAPE